MSKNTLSLEEQTTAITAYLKGVSPKDIATQFSVDTKAIKALMENRELRTNVEKKHIELTQAKESRKIDEIKEQILDFISTTIKEATEDEDRKILFVDKISKLITDLDRVSRLNREQTTSNDVITNKNIKIDVAEIIGKLQTPDQKKAFLRDQLIVTPNEE